MNIAPVPAHEQDRLMAIKEYFIPDNLPEADFSDINLIAAQICATPIAVISVLDGSRYKIISINGATADSFSTQNDIELKALATSPETLIINDWQDSGKYHSHTFQINNKQINFYAGVPIITPEGSVIGALTVMDYQAREISEVQVNTLQVLAKQVITQLELRKKNTKLEQTKQELKRSYVDLEKFSSIANHDLKSPLNNIISLTQLLKDYYGDKFDAEGNEYVAFLYESAYRLSDMVSAILNYSRTSQLSLEKKEEFAIEDLIFDVRGLMKVPENAIFKYNSDITNIVTSRNALKQILINLLHNAYEYNDKEQAIIEINVHEDRTMWLFEVKDNGPGILPEDATKVFEIFERLHRKIKSGESMGIGLAIVKRLVEKLGGAIKVTSEPGHGASFEFSVPK